MLVIFSKPVATLGGGQGGNAPLRALAERVRCASEIR